MTDTLTVRLVVVLLGAAVLAGMLGEAWLIGQVISAPADRVKDVALLLTAFTALPQVALGGLCAVLVSTRSSGSAGDGVGTVSASIDVNDAPVNG